MSQWNKANRKQKWLKLLSIARPLRRDSVTVGINLNALFFSGPNTPNGIVTTARIQVFNFQNFNNRLEILFSRIITKKSSCLAKYSGFVPFFRKKFAFYIFFQFFSRPQNFFLGPITHTTIFKLLNLPIRLLLSVLQGNVFT